MHLKLVRYGAMAVFASAIICFVIGLLRLMVLGFGFKVNGDVTLGMLFCGLVVALIFGLFNLILHDEYGDK